jgi:hypothetical protein
MRWPLLAFLGFCTMLSGAAGEPATKSPTDAEIKALVDQLVNPNPRPMTNKSPRFRYPKDFDHEKERKVDEARRKLLDLGTRAFPFLIERWDDHRYSLVTCNGLSGAYDTMNVGSVCYAIVYSQVQPYGTWAENKVGDPRSVPGRPGYSLGEKKEALIWWEKNKSKSLKEIQLEVLDWVIAEETKKPKSYIDEERKALADMRAELVKTGNAIPPGSYYATEFLPPEPK